MTSLVLLSIVIYLLAIFLITRFTGNKSDGNTSFFLAGRTTPWWVVAIGMIGDSISGVTFISVPGMVRASGMSYIQLCIGFFLGYIIVAYVLLPLYYRLNVVSIYEYLGRRFGQVSYKTGAWFFFISKMFGAAAKLYLVTMILQQLAFESLGIPYPLTVFGIVSIIWLYTRRGGMGTIIWTDILQTSVLFAALLLIVYQVASTLGFDVLDIWHYVEHSPHSRVWQWADWSSSTHLVKQLVSGAFIVVVMTGLDQNMMQKNLTCRSLRDAQTNMLTYGFSFIPLNYLFLVLGILLLAYAEMYGIALPEKGDEILPLLAGQYMGGLTLICFAVGITASSFSNADSALTSLTTSCYVDILGIKAEGKDAVRKRDYLHLAVCFLFALLILFIANMQQSSVLDTIFTAVSYTYGPLLGLYAFGLLSERDVRDRLVPYVCILSPILSHFVKLGLSTIGYQTSYELLLLNGCITMVGLWLIRKR